MSWYRFLSTGILAIAIAFVPTGTATLHASLPDQAKTSAAPLENTDTASKVAGQWIVVTDPTTAQAADIAALAARRSGGHILSVYEHAVHGFAIKGVAKQVLERLPGVRSIEPDMIVTAFSQTLPTGVDRIKADTNDTANINGQDERVDVDVAVIDTGVDLDHPDLNVFVGVDCTKGPNCQKGGDGDDGNGHGTHVSGTIGALDNNTGVVGVAPGARIWGVKVLRDDGSGFLSDVIEGIDYVTANAGAIEAANMSLGAQGQSSAFHAAVKNSVQAGVFHAVAAGNSDVDIYGPDGTFGTNDDIIPAAYPEAAAISALSDTDGTAGGNGPLSSWGGSDRDNDGVDDGEDDSFAFFSNSSQTVVPTNPVSSPGAAIDLLLPGVDIYSTWLGGQYHTISGTSMASPHGAGLAGLYIAENGRDADSNGVINDDDVYAVRQALIDAGITQDGSDGLVFQNDPDSNQEHIGQAGSSGVSGTPTVDITNPADGATFSGTTTIQADASDPDGNVTQVEFFVDGTSVDVDSDSLDGWSTDWNTTTVSDGDHTIIAEATDNDGHTSSDTITVTVDNNDAPSILITQPGDGATVADTITIAASSSDPDGNVTQVEFFVDGTSVDVDSDSLDGWSTDWNTTTVSDGDHTIIAEATDDDGESSSHSILVTVDNNLESTPVVDALTLDEDNSGGSPHAEFTVSWSVSDSDGNLDTVWLTLRDLTTGEVEETASVDVSGSLASGTETLKAKFDENNGHEYEVELVVTDTNGNTTSATASEVEDGS